MLPKSYTQAPPKIQKVTISVPFRLQSLFQQNGIKKTVSSQRTYTIFDRLKNFEISQDNLEKHQKWRQKKRTFDAQKNQYYFFN